MTAFFRRSKHVSRSVHLEPQIGWSGNSCWSSKRFPNVVQSPPLCKPSSAFADNGLHGRPPKKKPYLKEKCRDCGKSRADHPASPKFCGDLSSPIHFCPVDCGGTAYKERPYIPGPPEEAKRFTCSKCSIYHKCGWIAKP